MDLRSLPLHRMRIDKSACLAGQDRKITADLTKDVYRKLYEQQQSAKKE